MTDKEIATWRNKAHKRAGKMGIPSREQDDAAQEASIAVWKASTVTHSGDTKAWLGRAMENSLRDYRSKLLADKRIGEVMGYNSDE